MCHDSASWLGPGFPEVIDHRNLAIELEASIDFEQEISRTVYYDKKVDGILIEIKSRSCLDPTHFAQIKNYLSAFELEIGLLINFREKSLVY